MMPEGRSCTRESHSAEQASGEDAYLTAPMEAQVCGERPSYWINLGNWEIDLLLIFTERHFFFNFHRVISEGRSLA